MSYGPARPTISRAPGSPETGCGTVIDSTTGAGIGGTLIVTVTLVAGPAIRPDSTDRAATVTLPSGHRTRGTHTPAADTVDASRTSPAAVIVISYPDTKPASATAGVMVTVGRRTLVDDTDTDTDDSDVDEDEGGDDE